MSESVAHGTSRRPPGGSSCTRLFCHFSFPSRSPYCGPRQVPVAGRRDLTAFCWLVVLAAWCYGLWHDVGGLELVVVEVFGHSRLTSVSDLPPFGTIAVNLLLIPLAFILWRRTGWPLLLVGAAFILLVNGAVGAEPWGYVAGNAAEVVFILCLLSTERFLIRQPFRTHL